MKIVIIGEGGHSKVIQDMICLKKGYQVIGYLDDKYMNLSVRNNLYFGPITAINEVIEREKDIRLVVGIGNNHIRKLIVEKLALSIECYITLIHNTATVSPSAKIGFGTVVMANSVINANAQIGDHAIVNTGAIIEHDNCLGDFTHISPNATLTGGVQIDEGVHVGAGATIIPNLTVKKWSTIGAGATVINSVPAKCIAVGVPAQMKMKEEAEV